MKFAQIVFAGIFASSAFWPVSSTAEIAVGVAGPMTGPNSVFGIQMLHGAEQAITDINAAGGILGQKLVASVKDDRSDPAEGIAIANQFSKEGVKWVVGHFNSGVSIPVSEVTSVRLSATSSPLRL